MLLPIATALTDFCSHNYYNNEILLFEIETSIYTLKPNSPGIDKVHNNFLKNLPPEYLVILQNIYNNVFYHPYILENSLTLMLPIDLSSKTQIYLLDKSEYIEKMENILDDCVNFPNLT